MREDWPPFVLVAPPLVKTVSTLTVYSAVLEISTFYSVIYIIKCFR